MHGKKMSRREFLAKSALGAATVAVSAGGMLAPSRVLGANERISIGVIGVGGRGFDLMKSLHGIDKALNVEITAICDVYRPRREQIAKEVQNWYGREPRQFSDYEELITLDDVDGVIVATPDFAHCKVLADAMKAGKDAYVEKPMANNLADAILALDTAKETGRVVQVGTQRRSEGMWKAAAKMVQSGILGKVSRVEIAWNDCGPRWKRGIAGIKEEDVDWKRYLMGLPDRPFNASFYREWHLYRETTNGVIGLLGSHYIDVAQWLMDDPFPSTAVAHGGHYVWNDGREHEDTVSVLYDYPKGFMVRYLTGLGNEAEIGCRIYGTNGMFTEAGFVFNGTGGRGDKQIKEQIKVQPEPNESHVGNWIECMRSRKQTNAPIEIGYQHSVACILGYQALITGKKMKYLPTLRRIVEA